MNKYRVKQINDDWLLFVPVIGWFVMFLGMMLGGYNNTYKIQKRFLYFFWKDIETVYNKKEAEYKCNELNGIHNHVSEFVYLHDRIHDKAFNIPIESKTIIKVEYCPVCGKILSVKKAREYAYKSSFQAIKKFKEITNADIKSITLLTDINNKMKNEV